MQLMIQDSPETTRTKVPIISSRLSSVYISHRLSLLASCLPWLVCCVSHGARQSLLLKERIAFSKNTQGTGSAKKIFLVFHSQPRANRTQPQKEHRTQILVFLSHCFCSVVDRSLVRLSACFWFFVCVSAGRFSCKGTRGV